MDCQSAASMSRHVRPFRQRRPDRHRCRPGTDAADRRQCLRRPARPALDRAGPRTRLVSSASATTVRCRPGRTDRARGRPVSRLGGHGYLAWLQTAAERHGRAAGCDLIHFTNGVSPVRSSTPFVVTIHDLSLLGRPSQHPVARLARVPFTGRRVAIGSARHHALGGDRRRRSADAPCPTLPTRGDPTRRASPRGRPQTTWPSSGRLGLTERRYVLSIGTIEPRKNGVGLAGAPSSDWRRTMRTCARVRRRPGMARRRIPDGPWRRAPSGTGSCSPATCRTGRWPPLLGGCAVMAYPSFQEGFGLPVVEAMAAGAPVVTSAGSSLHRGGRRCGGPRRSD